MALDANELGPGLWIGAFPPLSPQYNRHAVAAAGFTTLVLCAVEWQLEGFADGAEAFLGVEVAPAPMYDAPLAPSDFKALQGLLKPSGRGGQLSQIVSTAFAAADVVAERIGQGRRVLVTCNQGRNRSGLVCALALCRRMKCAGRVALKVVRDRRRNALTNADFAKFLEMLPAPRR